MRRFDSDPGQFFSSLYKHLSIHYHVIHFDIYSHFCSFHRFELEIKLVWRLRNICSLMRTILKSISLQFIWTLFSSRKLELNSFEIIFHDCFPILSLFFLIFCVLETGRFLLALKYLQRLLLFVVFQPCKQPVGFMVPEGKISAWVGFLTCILHEDFWPSWCLNPPLHEEIL